MESRKKPEILIHVMGSRKINYFCTTILFIDYQFFCIMISRRLLRIKVLQILYAYFQKDDRSIPKSEKELLYSINKTHELFHYLIILILDIADYANSRIDIAKQKHIPSYDDLNPNTRFVNNRFVSLLRDDKSLNSYLLDNKINWVNNQELIRSIYRSFAASEEYHNFMHNDANNFEEDKNVIIHLISVEFINNELLYTILEEKSIYWNDDIEFVLNIMVKSFKTLKASAINLMPETFKNNDDKQFTLELFRNTVLNYEKNMLLIDKYSKNWDIERVAFMDILIMQLAISEFLEFESIPVKVTLNEYIEISKYYSTKKSNFFINGILDKITHTLKEENKIKKSGRGLIGEI